MYGGDEDESICSKYFENGNIEPQRVFDDYAFDFSSYF